MTSQAGHAARSDVGILIVVCSLEDEHGQAIKAPPPHGLLGFYLPA
ncbi:hypothetical protein [Arboricoccus pini]|nr:hypothetical protein [Arboricoccus pini]